MNILYYTLIYIYYNFMHALFLMLLFKIILTAHTLQAIFH